VLKFEVVKFQSGPTFLGDKGPNVLGDTALFKVLGTLDNNNNNNNNLYIYGDTKCEYTQLGDNNTNLGDTFLA